MRRREREFMFENQYKDSGVSDQQYYLAYKRVKRIKGFYVHLAVYVLVNLFLIFNKRFESGSNEIFTNFQTYSTAFFWGIGLVAHGLSVFGKEVFFGNNWEEKKIKELMQKDKNNQFE